MDGLDGEIVISNGLAPLHHTPIGASRIPTTGFDSGEELPLGGQSRGPVRHVEGPVPPCFPCGERLEQLRHNS